METLNYLFSNGLIRYHCQSRFFLSYFRSTFPHKIQSHNLLHICSPLYSWGPVINPVYLPATDHKNYQLSNQQYFAAKCRGKALICKAPRATSNVNLSPTQSPNNQNTVQVWLFLQGSNWVIYGRKGLHQYVVGLIYLLKNYEKDVNLLLE